MTHTQAIVCDMAAKCSIQGIQPASSFIVGLLYESRIRLFISNNLVLAFIEDALQVVACGGSLNFLGLASTWTRIERLEPVVLVHRRFVL